MQIKSASFFQKFNCTTYVTFLSTSKIPQTKAMLKIFSLKSYIHGGGGGGLEGSRNDVSFKGYQAKGDEKRQGEKGGS
jgi:hypothetical protein